MKADEHKIMIEFQDHRIPVYYTENKSKAVAVLASVLERKWKSGRGLVQRFLRTLDSVEIEGSEAILYSTRERETLAISLY